MPCKGSNKTSTGLKYVITKKRMAKKTGKGAALFIHYAGFLEDGHLF
jgi:peptidylprolyl isomerase